MFYLKSFIESTDKKQIISLESIQIPCLHKTILCIVNRSRIPPYLDPDDCMQRNNILNILKKSLLTICFDVGEEYQRIVTLAGYSSESVKLYDCCYLTALDQNVVFDLKYRKGLNRRKKRLSEIGEINFRVNKAQDIDNFKFARFFRLLNLSYVQGRVNTMWGMEKNKNLLKEVLNFDSSFLFELTINNKPIAFSHCQLMSNNRLVGMIITYDTEYAKYAPGLLLNSNILNYCAANNMVFDLGKGIFDYKEQYANSKVYSLFAIFIFNKNIGKMMILPIKLLLKFFIFLKRR